MPLPINQAPIFQPTCSISDQIESRSCETSCGNGGSFLRGACSPRRTGAQPRSSRGQAFAGTCAGLRTTVVRGTRICAGSLTTENGLPSNRSTATHSPMQSRRAGAKRPGGWSVGTGQFRMRSTVRRQSTNRWRAALISCRSGRDHTCTAVHRARLSSSTLRNSAPSSAFRARAVRRRRCACNQGLCWLRRSFYALRRGVRPPPARQRPGYFASFRLPPQRRRRELNACALWVLQGGDD